MRFSTIFTGVMAVGLVVAQTVPQQIVSKIGEITGLSDALRVQSLKITVANALFEGPVSKIITPHTQKPNLSYVNWYVATEIGPRVCRNHPKCRGGGDYARWGTGKYLLVCVPLTL